MLKLKKFNLLLGLILLTSCQVPEKRPSPTPSPTPSLAKVTIIPFGGSAFYVTALVNQVPERFVVDTGATFVSFPAKDLPKLRLTANGGKSVAAIADGSFQQTTFLTIPTLEIGGCVLHNVQGEATDNQSIALFGLSGFNHLTLTLHNNQMSFSCDK